MTRDEGRKSLPYQYSVILNEAFFSGVKDLRLLFVRSTTKAPCPILRTKRRPPHAQWLH